MEIFQFDFLSLFSISNITAIVIGIVAGLIIGALPGLGSVIAVVLLLPFTYSMSPIAAILMLLATYQAAEYGGSISSIILGVPGTPAAAATLIDGNALAKKGHPGKALGFSLIASTIGGFIGGVVLLLLAVPLSALALKLSSPEYFLIATLGLLCIGGLSTQDKTKSYISVVLGLIVGTVGMDMFTGKPRFTFGQVDLLEGIPMVTLMVGIFAITEIFIMIELGVQHKYSLDSKGIKTKISFKEFKETIKATIMGSGIGSVIGIIPGMGAGVASWVSYSSAKGSSKNKKEFGKGNPEGISAPESSNNASVGGSLLPLLTLGLPGSPTIAVVMGGFIIHGIQPGPKLLESESTLVYSVLYGFLITTLVMFLIGKLVTPLFSRVLVVPNNYLIPAVLMLSIIGVYASEKSLFQVWIAIAIGIFFYILRKLKFSLPSFILAFVLGPIIEENLRRTLLVSDGSYLIFIQRPFSIGLLIVMLGITSFLLLKRRKVGQAA